MARGVCLLSFATAGCRVRSNEPYWIEAHGNGVVNHVAGWSAGALCIGSNQQLWSYPGPYARPWAEQAQTHPLRSIAAGSDVAYALTVEGEVARFEYNSWRLYEDSKPWSVSDIGATDDNGLLVITAGNLRAFAQGELRPLSCDAITSVAVAGVHGDEAFVLDPTGALYLNADGRCQNIPAPQRLRRIAARPGRLVALAEDGSVWRRRSSTWSKLPVPFKYRTGQAPAPCQPQDIGASLYSTWLVDTEGDLFLLSDES
ncbi:MAG: hypothetical protein ABJB12_11330 [Pseudomonadota bacterium]